MTTRSWEDLPLELLKSVLLRVNSVRELCCCRSVSKAWNHVIKEPGFASLHAKSTPQPESYVLTAPRKVIKSPVPYSRRPPPLVVTESEAWQLLDLATKRTYSIPDTFIREGLRRSGTVAADPTSLLKFTLAASGGLIYIGYRPRDTFRADHTSYVVCNPVSKSFHQIPGPPFGLRGEFNFTNIAMFVETATQRYRIVVMECLPFRPETPDVCLYDSRVRIWRRLCDAPGVEHWSCSSVVLDGIFYTMFEDFDHRRYELYSCDLETGEWRFIDVPLPQSPPLYMLRSRSQVVAAAGRLFFVTHYGPAGSQAVILVTIWKSAPEERRVAPVARLPMLWKYNHVYPWTCPVVALGYGDSIVVSFFDGRRVRWDASRNKWYEMAPFLPKSPTSDFHSFFVSRVHLQMNQMPPQ